MAILAIDCSFGGYSVALLAKQGEQAISLHRPRTHASEGLIDGIDHVLDKAGLKLEGLDAFACAIGPGNFSGIRSACGVSQGLSFVTGIKVALVHTTLALACASGMKRPLVCYPAHRGHCYMASYVKTGQKLKEYLSPSLLSLDALPSIRGDWEYCPRMLSGKWRKVAHAVTGNLSRPPAHRGTIAPAVAKLGLAMARGRALVKAENVLPLYVRDKVALTISERKSRTAK